MSTLTLCAQDCQTDVCLVAAHAWLGHREEAEEALGGLLAALDSEGTGSECVLDGKLASEDGGHGGGVWDGKGSRRVRCGAAAELDLPPAMSTRKRSSPIRSS
jgi:hypothetical protein